MYISRDEFEALTKARKLSCVYDEVRQEIANDHFEGNAKFTIHDALDTAKTSSAFGHFGGESNFDDDLSSKGADAD
jgi:hypothetical protein